MTLGPFTTYESLRDAVTTAASSTEIIGYAPGGRPLLAARAGGDRQPAIMLTAGSHATEHAGVVAAVRLLDELDTPHELVVVPSRDPVGVDGMASALALGLGHPQQIEGYAHLAEILREHGEPVVNEGELVIALIGEYVYATTRPGDGAGTSQLKERLSDLHGDPAWDALAGRRVFLVPGEPDVEETRDFDRVYTLVISPDGEQLHLNRYQGETWGPAESRAVTQLFDAVSPGLFVDIHEYLGDGNWISIRPQSTSADRERAERIGREMIAALDAGGRRLTNLDEFAPDSRFLSELAPGMFDLDYAARGEGYNATDYAAEHHGLAFTHETGMYTPFEERVTAAVESVKTAVSSFEDGA